MNLKMLPRFLTLLSALFAATPAARAAIAPWELAAPKIEISGGNVNFTIQPSVIGHDYRLQYSNTMAGGTWYNLGVVRTGNGANLGISTPYVAGVARRFYRIWINDPGLSLIAAGSFQMGNALAASEDGYIDELPVHPVDVSAYFMANYPVTKALWDEVRTWAASNGYSDLPVGGGKASTHPVHTVNWLAAVKWCNARSQKEGLTPCYYTNPAQTEVFKTGPNVIANTMVKWSANGYRLPTEAEWEKAARGGVSGRRFPWGDDISHTYANYNSFNSYPYEALPDQGYHPAYRTGARPYTSPVGSFAANGYGLYDMAGNLSIWCWDWYGGYPPDLQTDPRGPTSGSYRVARGGSWDDDAYYCRVSARFYNEPSSGDSWTGFRVARTFTP